MTLHRPSTAALLAASIALACTALPCPARAHEPAAGAHGGLRVDAGRYHVELVADGSTTVAVFLSDAADKPVPAEGFKANAILVVDGKPQRFPLAPAGDARLEGHAPTPVPKGVKGAVQITAPDGTTAQAKF